MAILKTSGLTKSFGNLRAVRDVCFEVREGEIYRLLGPNGAGKTTTISMISGLLKPDAGQVVVAEIVSDSMRIVGHVTPTAWAMDFLHQLISYGGGPRDVLVETAVLLGFAAGSNALAAKFFRC